MDSTNESKVMYPKGRKLPDKQMRYAKDQKRSSNEKDMRQCGLRLFNICIDYLSQHILGLASLMTDIRI